MANYGKDINKIYPGKTCTKPKSLNKHKVVIKNINPEISKNLTQIIHKVIFDMFHLKRIYSAITHQPLPVISLTCKYWTCNKLSSEDNGGY